MEDKIVKLDRNALKMLDRQIRLFGRDLQIKLMNSKIAVVGFSALNTEIAKNLVLKALNVDIFDSTVIDIATCSQNFLFSTEDIGKQRSEAAVSIFRDMNPIVKINAFPSIEITDHINKVYKLLSGYDILVVEANSIEDIRLWDDFGTKLKKAIFIGTCCGHQAFVFCSLGKGHEVISVKNKGKKNERKYKVIQYN